MRARALTALVLTAVLFLLPPFAAQCDLQCNIVSTGHSGHPHHAMPGTMTACASGPAMVTVQTPACQHEPCVQQPTVVADTRSAEPYVTPAAEPVMTGTPPFAPVLFAVMDSGHDPPIQAQTPVALNTTLRI